MENSASRSCAYKPSGCTAGKSTYHEATGAPANSAGGNACERDNQEGSEGQVEARVGLNLEQLIGWDLHVLLVAPWPLPSMEGTIVKGTANLGGLPHHNHVLFERLLSCNSLGVRWGDKRHRSGRPPSLQEWGRRTTALGVPILQSSSSCPDTHSTHATCHMHMPHAHGHAHGHAHAHAHVWRASRARAESLTALRGSGSPLPLNPYTDYVWGLTALQCRHGSGPSPVMNRCQLMNLSCDMLILSTQRACMSWPRAVNSRA